MNKEQKKFKVDFIGIGVQKAATTWIWKCLTEHPQVCNWGGKEIHFFNKKKTKYHPVKYCKYKKEGIEGYKEYFKECREGKLIGEWSPHYIVDETVSFLIKKHFPQVKILVSLRNPIERAYSQYFHVLSEFGDKKEFNSFGETIQKESEFIEKGLYYKQLKSYFELFPKKNILVLIYEDIKEDPDKFIKSIYRFLEIEQDFVPSSLQKIVSPKEVKNSWIHNFTKNEFFHRFRKTNLGKKIIYQKTIRKIYDSLTTFYFNSVQPEVPTMEQETRRKLRKVYKKDIKKLEELINRDLSFWK